MMRLMELGDPADEPPLPASSFGPGREPSMIGIAPPAAPDAPLGAAKLSSRACSTSFCNVLANPCCSSSERTSIDGLNVPDRDELPEGEAVPERGSSGVGSELSGIVGRRGERSRLAT